ncbi:MAG: arsenate reductase family protein [Pseudomonadota bacterium]
MITFYGYKKCGTSRKGEKFLNENNLDYTFIDITLSPPSRDQLEKIILQTEKPIKKFFNTSGVIYREMQLKDKLKFMSENEMIDLLASNGKLIKRPLLTNGDKSSVAFNEEEFNNIWH